MFLVTSSLSLRSIQAVQSLPIGKLRVVLRLGLRIMSESRTMSQNGTCSVQTVQGGGLSPSVSHREG
jgi:hypothetical protein